VQQLYLLKMPEGTKVAVLLLSNDLVAGRHTSFCCWLLAWLDHDGRMSVGSSSLRKSLALAPPRGDMADQVAPKFKNSIYRNGMANISLLARSHTLENSIDLSSINRTLIRGPTTPSYQLLGLNFKQ
jgi:hypothetical protein